MKTMTGVDKKGLFFTTDDGRIKFHHWSPNMMLQPSKTWLSVLGALPLCVLLWSHVRTACQQPLYYRIGHFDHQFGIDEGTFRDYIEQAERIWEEALGKNMFEYDPSAAFAINLVFDGRQQGTLAKQNLHKKLASIESSHTMLAMSFEQWHEMFKEKKRDFQKALTVYRKRLATYQSTVQRWNQRGGAPPRKFRRLEQERYQLQRARAALDAEQTYLHELFEHLQSMRDRGEHMAQDYQDQIKTYHQRYGEPSLFNQGEYNGKAITIYQYTDGTDLTLVLAHELGHALGLEHVDNPRAIMHYLKGGQITNRLTLTDDDVNAAKIVCRLD